MPWLMETTAPAVNSPKAANIDQTYASLPYPKGCRVSRCRSDRRSAISRKISLPVSAQEWAASATMDADAVSEAATVLAMAISRFATNATITVITLSPPPVSVGVVRPFVVGSCSPRPHPPPRTPTAGSQLRTV